MDMPGHLTKSGFASVISLHVTLREGLGIPAVCFPYHQILAFQRLTGSLMGKVICPALTQNQVMRHISATAKCA